jgi:hypothetical protein
MTPQEPSKVGRGRRVLLQAPYRELYVYVEKGNSSPPLMVEIAHGDGNVFKKVSVLFQPNNCDRVTVHWPTSKAAGSKGVVPSCSGQKYPVEELRVSVNSFPTVN